MNYLHTAEILYTNNTIYSNYAVLLSEDGIVLEFNFTKKIKGYYDKEIKHQILMPGVINCHTHLTDSFHKKQVSGGEGLVNWVRNLINSRNLNLQTEDQLKKSVEFILNEMMFSGTVAIGEVSNDFKTINAIIDSRINCLFNYELTGFKESNYNAVIANSKLKIIELQNQNNDFKKDNLNWVYSAHAPYSVSLNLLKLIKDENNKRGGKTFQHLAEDSQERKLYINGNGEFVDLLKYFNAFDENWIFPKVSPIQLYNEFELLDENYVGVHLTDCTANEIVMLSTCNCYGVLCPITNLHITKKLPPFEEIIKNKLKFGLGTDGLGSNWSSNVFDEAKLLLENWYGLAPGILLKSLTSIGAEILGFNSLGKFQVGNNCGMISIETNTINNDLKSLEEGIILNPTTRNSINFLKMY